MSKPKTKSDIIRYVIMGVALCVFIVCGVMLIRIGIRYKNDRNNNSSANKFVETAADPTGSDPTKDTEASTDGETKPQIPSFSANKVIDFSGLKEEAPSVQGWIDVPSAGISYPIVQAGDNEYYLTHAYNDVEAWSGAIFLDHTNNPDFTDDHTFVYGHNMNDGSMFHGLLQYEGKTDGKKFYDKQMTDNGNYFYVYLEDSVRVYQIFSVSVVNIKDNYDAFRYLTDSFKLKDYVDYVMSIEQYDTGISYDGKSPVLTLYTCQSDSASGIRLMVHGQLVEVVDPKY